MSEGVVEFGADFTSALEKIKKNEQSVAKMGVSIEKQNAMFERIQKAQEATLRRMARSGGGMQMHAGGTLFQQPQTPNFYPQQAPNLGAAGQGALTPNNPVGAVQAVNQFAGALNLARTALTSYTVAQIVNSPFQILGNMLRNSMEVGRGSNDGIGSKEKLADNMARFLGMKPQAALDLLSQGAPGTVGAMSSVVNLHATSRRTVNPRAVIDLYNAINNGLPPDVAMAYYERGQYGMLAQQARTEPGVTAGHQLRRERAGALGLATAQRDVSIDQRDKAAMQEALDFRVKHKLGAVSAVANGLPVIGGITGSVFDNGAQAGSYLLSGGVSEEFQDALTTPSAGPGAQSRPGALRSGAGVTGSQRGPERALDDNTKALKAHTQTLNEFLRANTRPPIRAGEQRK